MRGVNKAIIVGHLGQDPVVRYMPSGQAVAEMSVATSEEWHDKQTGNKEKRTEWHRIVFFGKLAEICAEYLKKGAPVYIEGKIQTDKYTDKKTGTEKYSTKIIGGSMQMLGSKADGDAPAKSKPAQKRLADDPKDDEQQQTQGPLARDGDDFDDDIPF